MAMLEVKNLEVYYGVIQAIKGISFEVNEGEVIALIGANGAGKTTTIKILTGQLKPTSGNAEILGIECDKINERIYEQIGIVTDSSGVYERMNL